MPKDPRRFRFRPPPLAPSPELRWVLVRAFAPVSYPAPPVEGGRTLELATALGLAARIAVRIDRAALAAELGAAAAEQLQRERALAVAGELRAAEAIEAAARAAAAIGCPVAVLKGRALTFARHAAPGARPAQDLDLLAPRERLVELERALLGAGFEDAGGAGYEHQRPPLRHAGGEIVELHRHLPGVRLDGRASAGFAELERAGLLEPVAAGDRPAVPARAVLAAHALVHVLGQHGLSGRYPGWLLIADLLDLGVERDERASWRPWLAADLAATEIDAALALAGAVAGGVDPFAGAVSADAAALARHFVGVALDAGYVESLKRRAFESPVSERGPAAARLGLALRALVPARRPGERGVRRAAAWLARPYVLLRKALVSWRAARRLPRGSTRIAARNDERDD